MEERKGGGRRSALDERDEVIGRERNAGIFVGRCRLPKPEFDEGEREERGEGVGRKHLAAGESEGKEVCGKGAEDALDLHGALGVDDVELEMVKCWKDGEVEVTPGEEGDGEGNERRPRRRDERLDELVGIREPLETGRERQRVERNSGSKLRSGSMITACSFSGTPPSMTRVSRFQRAVRRASRS